MERAMLRPSIVMRSRGNKRARGFTLVELAVVVAIIGILAVLALVGYRRYMLHSKMTEARAVIAAIKIAQEDFRAERGIYANLGAQWCPAAAGSGDRKVGWDPNCNGGTATWQNLAVHVSGGVHFQYRTAAGTGAYDNPLNVVWVAGTVTQNPWYVVHARCDLDSHGGDETELFTTSQGNEIFSRNDGE
jgi:type IV pilus assembly protein PilA